MTDFTPSRDRVEDYVEEALKDVPLYSREREELRVRLIQLFHNAMIEAYGIGYEDA